MILLQSNPWSGIDIGAQLFAFSPMIVLTCTMLLVIATPIVLNRSARTIATVASVGLLAALIFAGRRVPLVPAAEAAAEAIRAELARHRIDLPVPAKA